jgi:hypothetical protein
LITFYTLLTSPFDIIDAVVILLQAKALSLNPGLRMHQMCEAMRDVMIFVHDELKDAAANFIK